jgi:AbrB family looped-hinge helix DNA binding protein
LAQATLTTKGQVTISKEIRDSLKFQTGDKIEIIATQKGEAIIKPISKKVDDLFCKLHRPGIKPAPLKSMDDAIRSRVKDRFK